jgi:hypothetical protein
MPGKSVSLTTTVLMVIAAVALASGATYYFQQRRVDVLQAAVDKAAADSDRRDQVTEALLERVNQLTAEASASALAAFEASAAATSPPNDPPAASAKPKTVKQFAYVANATESSGAIRLSLDYAEFLTGDAAAAAATAAGDESPPPNDFYIKNDNPKLRVLPVSASAKFTIALGGPDETASLSAGQFLDAIINNTDGAADAPYWFTIKAGVVTGGEEQWTP